MIENIFLNVRIQTETDREKRTNDPLPPKRLFFIVNFACQEFQVQTFVKSPFSPAAPPPPKTDGTWTCAGTCIALNSWIVCSRCPFKI